MDSPVLARKIQAETGLFALSCLVSVGHRDIDGESTAAPEGNQDASITTVAIGGQPGSRMIAAYCSNATLIFRSHNDTGGAKVRIMRWFTDPNRKIISMTFSPKDGQWLLCLTQDANLYLVPAYFLLKGSQKATTFAVDDVTCVKTSLKGGVVQVLWWKSWDGSDYAIIASNAGLIGNLTFVNLVTYEAQASVRLKGNAISMDIVADEPGFEYVTVNTTQGAVQVLVQQENENRQVAGQNAPPFDTIILQQAAKGSMFQPTSLPFGDAQVKPQKLRVGTCLGAYKPNTARLELYDSHMASKFAIFIYQLLGGARHIQVTDKPDDSGNTELSVISNLMAGVSAEPSHLRKTNSTSTLSNSRNTIKKESILQQFTFPESVEGVLPALEDTDELTGFLFWTSRGIYQCRQHISAESLFFQLIKYGFAKSLAEPLGQTVGLDLLTLYEEAGDAYFREQKYGQALDMYYLSGVESTKLIELYLSVGRLDVVMSHLRTTLYQPASLSLSDLQKLSDLFFRCYVMRMIMDPEEFEHMKDGFMQLIHTNLYYDIESSMELLLDNTLVTYLLQVSIARKAVPLGFDKLASRGLFYLSDDDIITLTASENLTPLVYMYDGRFVKAQRPSKQMDIYIAEKTLLPLVLDRILEIIPRLEGPYLQRSIEYFHPDHFKPKKVFSEFAERQSQTMGLDTTFVRKTALEIVFSCLLYLQKMEDGPKAQPQLLQLLRTQHDQYDAMNIIDRCVTCENWQAAALVYELKGDWETSFSCSLCGVDCVENPKQLVLELAEYHLEKANRGSKLDLLQQSVERTALNRVVGGSSPPVLSLWAEKEWDSSEIEQFLMKPNLDVTPALSRLLALNILPHTFSKSFFIHITSQTIQAAHARGRVTSANTNRLWEGVMENIHEAKDRRTIKVTDVGQLSNQEAIVFTCGHHYLRKNFFKSALPQLKARMEEMNIVNAAKRIMTEYHQKVWINDDKILNDIRRSVWPVQSVYMNTCTRSKDEASVGSVSDIFGEWAV
ncbi:hypothetical protein PROFUN_07963 [Planoprotostelium fungivorum]|uniref:Uncharacterized protein n=1 Tax=Planoprotostelium fungivorum TaxID=1890364 RepID=A0A2P6NL87_9EUKA|nr:hypothetical protein PROFUN_07963 [Planoprotostelium fungivorum]